MGKLHDANWRESLKNIVTENSVISNENKKELPQATNYNTIPASQGRGRDSSTKAAGSGGGIASPLTEQSHTFYDPQILNTSDGLFSIAFSNYHTATFTDSNNAIVVFNYLNS